MSTIDQVVGMTVNERLAHSNLFAAFDSAVASRNLLTIVAVLQQAKMTEQQARETAAAILADPGLYGLR